MVLLSHNLEVSGSNPLPATIVCVTLDIRLRQCQIRLGELREGRSMIAAPNTA
jgi:hypothetical protein